MCNNGILHKKLSALLINGHWSRSPSWRDNRWSHSLRSNLWFQLHMGTLTPYPRTNNSDTKLLLRWSYVFLQQSFLCCGGVGFSYRGVNFRDCWSNAGGVDAVGAGNRVERNGLAVEGVAAESDVADGLSVDLGGLGDHRLGLCSGWCLLRDEVCVCVSVCTCTRVNMFFATIRQRSSLQDTHRQVWGRQLRRRQHLCVVGGCLRWDAKPRRCQSTSHRLWHRKRRLSREQKVSAHKCSGALSTHTQKHEHEHEHTHKHEHEHTHTRTQSCTQICTHVQTHTHTHKHAHSISVSQIPL